MVGFDINENNRKILEKQLKAIIKELCIISRLGFADWDIDNTLAMVIKTTHNFNKCDAVCTKYDLCVDNAKAFKANIAEGFFCFYGLRNKQ